MLTPKDEIVEIVRKLVSEMTPVLTITDNVADGDNWKLSMCRTYWLHTNVKVIIGGLEYKVVSFKINEYIIVSGTSQPVVTSFTLGAPKYLHGAHRKVSGEMDKKDDHTGFFVYLPVCEPDENREFDSPVILSAYIKPLFLCTFAKDRQNTEQQYEEIIGPMNEAANYFLDLVLNYEGDRFERPTTVTRKSWLHFGDPTIWGNDKLIFNQPLSGVERRFTLDVLPDGVCHGICGDDNDPIKCAPIAFYLNDVFGKEVKSGDEFKVTTVNHDGDPVTATFDEVEDKIIVDTSSLMVDIAVNGTPFYTDVTTDQDLPVKDATGTINVGSKIGAQWRIGNSTAHIKNTDGDELITANVGAEQSSDFVVGDCEQTFNGDGVTSQPAETLKAITVINSALEQIGLPIIDTKAALSIGIGNSEVEINDSAGNPLYLVSIKAEGATVKVISDAVVHLKDSNGDTFANVSVKAQEDKNHIVGDGVVQILDSATVVLYTKAVKAQGNTNQIIADSTVNVKNSAGVTIHVKTVKAQAIADQVVSDSTVNVKRSNGTTMYAKTVLAETTADQTVTDSTVNVKDSAGTTLYAKTVMAESSADQVVTDSAVVLKDNLGNTLDTVTTKAQESKNKNISDFVAKKVYYNRPLIQSQTSYHDYDEGWMFTNNYDPEFYVTDGVLQRLDLSVSVDYLKYNNAFGHKFRFTGLNGGYYDFNTSTYKTVSGAASTFSAEFQTPVGAGASGGYVIDHLTGLGWNTHRGGSGGITWNNMWLNGITLMTYSDWFIPPFSYVMTLDRRNLTTVLGAGRPPFQWDQQWGWTNNTQMNATTNAFRYDVVSGQLSVTIKTSAGTANRIYMRLHYARTAYVLQP